MKTFNDANGNPWLMDVNVSALRRVKAIASLDIGDFAAIASGEILKRLAADPVLLADVAYAILKPEADTRGISKDDFCNLIRGDAIESVTTAILESLADFFPKAQGAVLKAVLSIARSETEKAMQETSESLAKMSGSPSPVSPES